MQKTSDMPVPSTDTNTRELSERRPHTQLLGSESDYYDVHRSINFTQIILVMATRVATLETALLLRQFITYENPGLS